MLCGNLISSMVDVLINTHTLIHKLICTQQAIATDTDRKTETLRHSHTDTHTQKNSHRHTRTSYTHTHTHTARSILARKHKHT